MATAPLATPFLDPSGASKADEGRPLISSGPGAMPQQVGVEVVHWRPFERVMDLFWTVFLIYASIHLLATASSGENGGWGTAIVGCILFGAFVAFLVLRPLRHSILVTPTTVVYKEYRCFGYVLKREETFARNDLGSLVFTTERRCCGLRGFTGVYVTRGVPTPNAPAEIAFQMRIIYNGWTMNWMRPMMVGAHFNTYLKLEHALGFRRRKGGSVEQVTQRNWEWVDGNREMVEQYNERLMDSLSSYDEYAAVNPALYPPNCSLQKDSQGGRTVFYI